MDRASPALAAFEVPTALRSYNWRGCVPACALAMGSAPNLYEFSGKQAGSRENLREASVRVGSWRHCGRRSSPRSGPAEGRVRARSCPGRSRTPRLPAAYRPGMDTNSGADSKPPAARTTPRRAATWTVPSSWMASTPLTPEPSRSSPHDDAVLPFQPHPGRPAAVQRPDHECLPHAHDAGCGALFEKFLRLQATADQVEPEYLVVGEHHRERGGPQQLVNLAEVATSTGSGSRCRPTFPPAVAGSESGIGTQPGTAAASVARSAGQHEGPRARRF